MDEMMYNDLIISTTLINKIYIPYENNDEVLLGSDSGVFLSDDNGIHFKYFVKDLYATKVYDFTESNGNIFAATDNGVYILKGKKWNIVGLPHKKVYSIKSFNSEIFAGTETAFFKMEHGKFKEVFHTSLNVQAISEFNGKLFFATPAGLFNAENKKKLLNIPILSIGSNKCMYVGTHCGIKKLCNGNDFQDTSVVDGIIRTITLNKNNILFAGTDNGLLVSKDEGETFEKRLKNAHIFSLFVSPLNDDLLFVGTWGRGLIRYKFTNSP